MTTLSELYFLNSGWPSDVVIRVVEGGEVYSIQGKDIPNCIFSDHIVSMFADDFVIIKEED